MKGAHLRLLTVNKLLKMSNNNSKEDKPMKIFFNFYLLNFFSVFWCSTAPL